MNSNPARRTFKLKKKIETRKDSLKSDASQPGSAASINSFLVEVEHNKDIDWKIRKDIEEKFKKSNVNAKYVFPRVKAEGNLPRINGERRHASQFDGGFANEVSGEYGEIESATGRISKMPNLSKKIVREGRKGVNNSVTPNPYFRERNLKVENLKRSTPSPALEWKVKYLTKKRLL